VKVALDASDASDTGTTVAEDAAGELLKQRTSSFLIMFSMGLLCLRLAKRDSLIARSVRADSHTLQTRPAVGVSLGTFHRSSHDVLAYAAHEIVIGLAGEQGGNNNFCLLRRVITVVADTIRHPIKGGCEAMYES
jgi:hypothetical protein